MANIPTKYGSGFVDWRGILGVVIELDTDMVIMPNGGRITRIDFEQMSRDAREALMAQGQQVAVFGVGGGGGAGGDGFMPNDLVERSNKEAAAAKPEPEPAPLEMPKLKFPELDI